MDNESEAEIERLIQEDCQKTIAWAARCESSLTIIDGLLEAILEKRKPLSKVNTDAIVEMRGVLKGIINDGYWPSGMWTVEFSDGDEVHRAFATYSLTIDDEEIRMDEWGQGECGFDIRLSPKRREGRYYFEQFVCCFSRAISDSNFRMIIRYNDDPIEYDSDGDDS